MEELKKPVVRRSDRPLAPAPKHRESVLIVHHDAIYRRTLSAYLDAQGFEVRLCEGGREALREVSLRQPGAIVMDVDGDELDEFELLSCLAALPTPTPVIVCTSYGGMDGPEQAILSRLGVRYVLPRPCRFELLAQALRHVTQPKALQQLEVTE